MTLKKILIINYEFPPLGGGGGHASEQIAREMVRKGYDVSVITSRFQNLPKQEERFGFQIFRIPSWRRHREKSSIIEMLFFLFSSLVFSFFLYFKIKPQLTISFFSIPSGPAAFLLKLFFRIPYVIALRGGDVPGFLPEQLAVFHKLTNWLNRLIWWQAAGITTNSDGLADLARQFYAKKEITVIPNGVDEKFFFNPLDKFDRERLGDLGTGGLSERNSKGLFNIITVGRLSKQKKVERLIESVNRLYQQGRNEFMFDIIGDGPERKKLEQLALKYNLLDKSVFFHGWCHRDALMEHYHKADVFALSSDFEGMPNVVLEAMASSLAVVATHSPGTVDLVQDGQNGFLISKETLEDLDNAFINLKNDSSLLKRYQQKSYEVAKKYTWQQVAAGYIDLSQSIYGQTHEAKAS